MQRPFFSFIGLTVVTQNSVLFRKIKVFRFVKRFQTIIHEIHRSMKGFQIICSDFESNWIILLCYLVIVFIYDVTFIYWMYDLSYL